MHYRLHTLPQRERERERERDWSVFAAEYCKPKITEPLSLRSQSQIIAKLLIVNWKLNIVRRISYSRSSGNRVTLPSVSLNSESYNVN